MKTSKKRFLSVMLGMTVFASVCTAFAGCGETNVDPDIPLDVDMNNKPTLNLHMQSAGMSEEEFNAEPTAKLLEELTGYKVNYTQLPSVDDTDALNLAFVNKSQYHAIKVTKAQYNMLMSNDALLNIKPALERYGQDMLKDISEYSWNVVSRDGGIYGIPEGGPPTEGQQNVSSTIVFRKDLLLDEGYSLPTTRDEFTDILRHFKQKYGATDSTYRPLTFTFEDSLIPAIAVSFGIYQEWVKVGNEWKFYVELPQYKEYMEYMTGLYNEGLIDLDAPTQDKAKAMAKFGQGKSVAIALGVWDTNTLYNNLVSNGQAKNSDTATDIIAAIKGFTDPDGVKNRTYHAGGYSYVTVIPKYMHEEAAYTIDHLNKKIKEENFKRMMIGEENVHWIYSGEQYRVIDAAKFAAEKNQAAFFATGINETYYPDYFICRIDGQVVKDFFLYLNENSDEEATYNPLNFTSLLPYYDTVRITLEEWVRDQAMNMMFQKKSTADYDSVVSKFYKDGGTKAKAEIKEWCDINWIY